MNPTFALFAFAIVACLGACAALAWAQREEKRRAREPIQELLDRIDRRDA
ncbi:hypothetical protein KUV74_12390 [Halomonas sp. DP1Y21-3]|nr:hypothetical protein [Halomonas sp. DP1Y21-3]MBY6111192.1 hypothetical protein [Halomonas sp. DP1Y21-3]